ncbi:hypothetical protein BC629DRAFT_1139768 [Irpex lacteus]|nr:hypothetical protein BC629DRAFT_1139768 [Irpex lacteus]
MLALLVPAQHTHTTCNKCLFLLGYCHIALQSISRRHAHLLLFPIGLHSHHGLSWFFFCKFRNKQFQFLYHELLPFLLMLLIICCHLLPLPLPHPPPPVLGPSQLYLYHARSTQSPHRTLVYTYIHHLPLLPPPSSLSLLIFCLSPKTHLTYYNSHMHPRVECYLLHASFSFSTSSFCLFTIIFSLTGSLFFAYLHFLRPSSRSQTHHRFLLSSLFLLRHFSYT